MDAGSKGDWLSALEESRSLFCVLLFFDAKTLTQLAVCDTTRNGLPGGLANAVWRRLCEHCWAAKSSRYHLTAERAGDLWQKRRPSAHGEKALSLETASPGTTWSEHYKCAFLDGARQSLRPEELSELAWAFNFTPRAGGRGRATLQIVEFAPEGTSSPRGQLHMDGYPPLPYQLTPDGRTLLIAHFPPHRVSRLESWEWTICNSQVTFVSCSGEIRYKERGFLEVTEEDIPPDRDTGDVYTQVLRMLRSVVYARREQSSAAEESED